MLNKIDKIKKLIAEDRLDDAFHFLEKTSFFKEPSLNKEAMKTIILNKARFVKMKNEKMALLPTKEYEFNIIRKNLLDLLDEAKNRLSNEGLHEQVSANGMPKFSFPNLSIEKIIILIIGVLVLFNAIYLLLFN